MMALQKWNGGVIIISHDEKFITTVANQVSLRILHVAHSFIIICHSFGCVVKARSRNSKEMYRLTRYLINQHDLIAFTDIMHYPGPYCQQHQVKAIVPVQQLAIG